MKYDVIVSDDLFELKKEVNERIKEGWRPLGGLIIDNEVCGDSCDIYTTGQYLQTMIKE